MSTSRPRPKLQAASPAAESAVRRSWAARAPKKNPSRRKIFRAASPCWAHANRARGEWTDPYCADLLPADSSPALRARRSAVPVYLRSLMRPPQRPAATVQGSSLSSGETGGTAGGNADSGSSAGAPSGRRGSSEVPHIPQKRKLGALSSLQFGQITIVLRMSFPIV